MERSSSIQVSSCPYPNLYDSFTKTKFPDNEYHDMDQTLVLNLNQAAINGIRAAGATSQYIFVEGNAWSGAWSWTNNNDNLKDLTDSEDKIVYEMHQYLDSDSSGTSETCVSSTIGKERLESATAWLQSNNKKGFIGEFAGGVNSNCQAAVEGMLSYMSENSDVWMGAEWWSAGPWWGSYMYSLEPSEGPAYSTYLPILEKYFVSGTLSDSTSSSSSTKSTAHPSTATAIDVTSIPNNQVAVPSSTVDSSSSTVTGTAEISVIAPITAPTVTATVTKDLPTATAALTTFVSAPSASKPAASNSATYENIAKHYYQCGGMNWTGPTACETGYTCLVQNPYYHQCV
jgi:endoglucanase